MCDVGWPGKRCIPHRATASSARRSNAATNARIRSPPSAAASASAAVHSWTLCSHTSFVTGTCPLQQQRRVCIPLPEHLDMSMKLGACYNGAFMMRCPLYRVCFSRLVLFSRVPIVIVWDAEELLEASINSIRKDVDYVVVVYQKARDSSH